MEFSKRNFAVMLFAIVLMGLGISLFKISVMGNDPSTAMVIAIGDTIGVNFSLVLIVFNSIWFIIEMIFGRKYIGAGTFVNWFGVGIIASGFAGMLGRLLGTALSLPVRLICMVTGVLILSLSASLYQTADLGIAPYDVLSIILADRLPVPYFFCRIFTDAVCTLVAFLFGGVIGLGTFICAFGLGPFITFFNKTVSEKICE